MESEPCLPQPEFFWPTRSLENCGHFKKSARRVFQLLTLLFVFCKGPTDTLKVMALEPSSRITQYGHIAWLVEQNGLDASPLVLAQTKDGYIWVGTEGGLFRFDGVHFTRWVAQSEGGISAGSVSQLKGTQDGSLYIGGERGLARLTHGKLYDYHVTMRFPGPFLEGAQGTVWMGDSGGGPPSNVLCRINADSLSCLSTKDGFQCDDGLSIASDNQKSIWVGSWRGICRWREGEKPKNFMFSRLLGPAMYNGGIWSLAADREGNLWAGSRASGPDLGLLKFSGGIWKSYKTPSFDGSKLPVYSLLFDHQGSLWIGTDGKGLYKLSNGRVDHFDIRDGLSGNVVRSLFEDREGNLWAVTDKGLDAFHDLPVVSITSREGLSDDSTNSLSTTSDGRVWIGTRHALNILKNQNFSYIREGQGLPTNDVGTVFRDSHDQLWVAGGQELFLYSGGRFLPVTSHSEATIGEVVKIAEDSNHDLWVSVQLTSMTHRQNALLHVNHLQVVATFPSPAIAGGHTLFALAPNPQGGMWVGGWVHGLFWFHHGIFEQVKPDGYDGQVLNLSSEADGSLWLATPNEGMIRYHLGHARRLTSRDGLPCNASIAVVDDHIDSHWFYTQCGIARIRDSELSHWWLDPTYHLTAKIFGPLDGALPFPNFETPSRDIHGHLWWTNGNSVETIDPNHLAENLLAPPVHVERLIVDRKDYPTDNSPRLQISPKEIEIDYAGLSYVIPETVQFRYRLVGHDKDWTKAGARRQAFFNDLSPGRYTFQVLACNNSGVWNTEGARIEFVIPPAWYQTLWFRLLCVFSAFGFIYCFYLIRLRQHTAAIKLRYDDRLEERTRIARDLHDTLLQTIQGSKLAADEAVDNARDLDAAKLALRRLSDWMGRAGIEGRAVLDSLRRTVEDKDDLMTALRCIFDDCRRSDNVILNASVIGKSEEIDPTVKEEIYRIGGEAIRNACLHSNANMLTVEIIYTGNMVVRIHDNGRGFDTQIIGKGKKNHYGLVGMRERAQRIGAQLIITSSSEGSETTLQIPGNVVYRKTSRHLVRRIRSIISWSK